MWILFILLTVIFIVGGLFVLFRTAKMPKIPEGFKRRKNNDDDSSGW